jgi:hypothetical protein
MADKTTASPIAMRSALTAVLEDLMPLAHDKDIDVGVTGDLSATVRCNEAGLRTMIRNLVENGIRYTPPGGQVELTMNHLLFANLRSPGRLRGSGGRSHSGRRRKLQPLESRMCTA